MIRISPAIRLALGLVVLMLSILFAAQLLKLVPNSQELQLSARKDVAENLAFQVLLAMSRTDDRLLQDMLTNAVKKNSSVRSVGVRFASGGYMQTTDGHEEYWVAQDSGFSTPDFVQIPLVLSGVKKGQLEIAFTPMAQANTGYFGLSRDVLLLGFLCISSFIGFWLFVKRALHYLDPSAVIPARVRNAMNVLAEGVLIVDRREQIVLANQALVSKLQLDERQLLGRKASSLGWEPMADGEPFPWESTLASGEKRVGVRMAIKQADGASRIFHVNAVPILDDKGGSQGVIASFDDVSQLEATNVKLQSTVKRLSVLQRELEEKNRKLEHLAARDPLTDCFNRRVMRERLDEEFQKAQQVGQDLICIMLDIDHFKKVNDTYGHAAGDAVIKMVASTVKSNVRANDIVARFGGEEFCVLLPQASVAQAKEIADRCRTSIEAQICDGVRVTSSFGISAVSLGAANPNDLVQQADMALYRSKQAGRNRVSLWTRDLPSDIEAKRVVSLDKTSSS